MFVFGKEHRKLNMSQGTRRSYFHACGCFDKRYIERIRNEMCTAETLFCFVRFRLKKEISYVIEWYSCRKPSVNCCWKNLMNAWNHLKTSYPRLVKPLLTITLEFLLHSVVNCSNFSEKMIDWELESIYNSMTHSLTPKQLKKAISANHIHFNIAIYNYHTCSI